MSRRDPTRRQFLKQAGAVGATAAIGGIGCEPRSEPGAQADSEAPGAVASSSAPAGSASAVSEPASGGLLRATEALFRPTARGCTLHWLAQAECEAQVLAGRTEQELEPVRSLSASGPTEVTIDNLPGDSESFIQCRFRKPGQSEWLERPVQRLRTARGPGQSFRAVVIADTHTFATLNKPGAVENTRATIEKVRADRPDFVVFIGDEASMIRNIYRGRRVSQAEALQNWQAWRHLYADLLAAVPCLLVLGNHEGEAGYYQSYQAGLGEPLALQRIATTARKQYFLNPLSDTYPEGGENEGWSEAAADTAAGGVASENRSPLQNYFAWTWGDALFVVLDCHRYTNPGGSTPASVDEWTLGTVQFEWFRKVLTASEAKWKVVLCHHLVGGWPWDGAGRRSETNYYYGRGGGRYARVGEQARITDLMNQTGARFFLYGHDHVFAHQPAEGIEFVCCGRPSYLNAEWYSRPGWREAYGRTAARDPHDFYAAIGYTRLSVSPAAFEIEYVRTGKDADGGDNVDTPIGQVAYRAAFS